MTAARERTGLWVAAALGVPAVVLAAGLVVAVRGAGRLARVEAALVAAGRPMDRTVLRTELAPDTSNAAALYAQVSEALARTPAPSPDRAGWLRVTAAALAATDRGEGVPEAVGSWLAREDVQALVAGLHRAAGVTDCVFPLGAVRQPLATAAHTRAIASLCDLLAVEALVAADEGDGTRAWAAVDAGFRCADGLAADPLASSQFARMAAGRILVQALRRAAERAPTSEETQRQAALRGLARLERAGPIMRALDGERLAWRDWSDRAAGGIERRLRTGQEAAFLAGMHRLTLAAAQVGEPGHALRQAPVERAAGAAERQILQALSDLVREQATLAAECRVTAVGLLVRQYHALAGQYPAVLDRVPSAEGVLAAAIDPFSGGPLQYRLEGRAAVLYSVAQDGRDDGGSSFKGENGYPLDLVWRP